MSLHAFQIDRHVGRGEFERPCKKYESLFCQEVDLFLLYYLVLVDIEYNRQLCEKPKTILLFNKWDNERMEYLLFDGHCCAVAWEANVISELSRQLYPWFLQREYNSY